MQLAIASQPFINGAGDTQYPNPFYDLASLMMPTNFRQMLYLAEFLWDARGPYRASMERIHSYFLTKLTFDDVSEDERKDWEEFLGEHEFDLLGVTRRVAMDLAAYNNAFVSLRVPFKRHLSCPKCGFMAPLSEVYDKSQYKFRWNFNAQQPFHATCPACAAKGTPYTGPWKIVDHHDASKVRAKLWSVHEIEIVHDVATEDTAYYWRIPEDYKNRIRKGELFVLERVDQEVLKAIQQGLAYRFVEDAFLHLKKPTLSGRLNRGWGMPEIVGEFRQILDIAIVHRSQTSVLLDYVVPMRVISPLPRPGSGSGSGGAASARIADPLAGAGGHEFRSYIRAMLRGFKRDPGQVMVSPVPLQMQLMGGKANELAPVELLNSLYSQLMNNLNVPIELFNGSMQLQAQPAALRLFEATHKPFVSLMIKLVVWVVNGIATLQSREPVKVGLESVTIADNIELKMLLAQLMMSEQASGTTLYRQLGLDYLQEQRRIAEEAKQKTLIQARVQEELQQDSEAQQLMKGQQPGAQQGGQPQQAQGQPQQGGQQGQPAPMPTPVAQYIASANPHQPMTPEDIQSVATSLATELRRQPESVKDSDLRKLKQVNPHLHAYVKELMAQMRKQEQQSLMAKQGRHVLDSNFD